MKKVYLLSILLVAGLGLSQILPFIIPDYGELHHVIKIATMISLAFIMIHVGYEFEIRKEKLREYGYDYLIAFTSATLPWIFISLYFVFVLTPAGSRDGQTWVESILAARFSAPTSAGVLFSMLAAAGLAGTWMFKKTRILAIFDDLDTVILMIPLQMLVIGFKVQLLIIAVIMFIQIWLAWKYLDKLRMSVRWKNVLIYAVLIAGVAELVYFTSKIMDETVGVHIEVLLPAFVLGTMISKRHNRMKTSDGKEEDLLEHKSEKNVAFIVSAVFMMLVGLSMPVLEGVSNDYLKVLQIDRDLAGAYVKGSDAAGIVPEARQTFEWGIVFVHVLIVTLLSNIGKIVPAFVYRNEAPWRERLAVAIAMFPRGEVGAGVLIISMSYGIGGLIVTVAMLSLALNLLLTGLFILIVKALLRKSDQSKMAAVNR
ncbi:MAG: sodium:proton antiporter [Bacteroidales bacterium]|nr:sodium:proton antiporter [Bacteroidales bacterium]